MNCCPNLLPMQGLIMDIIILLEISFLVLLPAEFISKMSRSREGNFKRLSNFSMLNIAFDNILILNFEFKRRNFYMLRKSCLQCKLLNLININSKIELVSTGNIFCGTEINYKYFCCKLPALPWRWHAFCNFDMVQDTSFQRFFYLIDF